MSLAAFDYTLPSKHIALRPARPRDMARLLVVRPSPNHPELADSTMRALPNWLRSGDVLVVNDTKVLPTRLYAHRLTGGRIEIQLLAPYTAESATSRQASWRALVRPARRLSVGETLYLDSHPISVQAREGKECILTFPCAPSHMERFLRRHGVMPLPPYIARRRQPDARDQRQYQTIFAQNTGAVATPTASLHFTPRLLAKLKSNDITLVRLTLHVNQASFAPLTESQTLYAEWGYLSSQAARYLTMARRAQRRIIAIGTTSLRLLETACDAQGRFSTFRGETSLFIKPGYIVRGCDALLTNFHLPKSSLFMLVCAYSGTQTMQHSYAHAIANNYRFYSYGDACLLYPYTNRAHATV